MNTQGFDHIDKRLTLDDVSSSRGPQPSTKDLPQAGFEKVVYLKDRKFSMLKKDLIFRNPLRFMGHETEAETALYIHVPEKRKKQALEHISIEGEFSWPFMYGGGSRLF